VRAVETTAGLWDGRGKCATTLARCGFRRPQRAGVVAFLPYRLPHQMLAILIRKAVIAFHHLAIIEGTPNMTSDTPRAGHSSS